MVKTKKNRVNVDDLLKKKVKQNEKKVNPFEIAVSKPKYAVLDRNPTSLRGQPGVSRSKAITIRKETLGKEFLVKHKNNRFTDHRKHGRNMGRDELEEAQRKADHKSMSARKKEKFKLNDNVVLTHKGQTLEEIERHDDVDQDYSDEDDGRLDAEFTEAAHFGGGEEDEEGDKRDRKTVIEEMIAESKKRKAEKQKENDAVFEMTQKLDKSWLDVIPLVGKLTKKDNEKPNLDDYDRTMREMIFERRGKPADKLKSEEELARVEKEKLEKLERERQARMKGEDRGRNTNHKSADDLDDGYWLQPIGDDEQQATSFDEDPEADGSLFNVRDFGKEKNMEGGVQEEKGDDESGSEEEESDQEADKEDEDEDSDDAESVDSLNDLKDEESESDSEAEKEAQGDKKGPKNSETKTEIQEEAANQLPFTFEFPDSYEELEELLKNQCPENQELIIDRMLKSSNPKFVRDAKKKMLPLFVYLIQHLNDTFSDCDSEKIENSFKVLDKMVKFLHDLCQANPQDVSRCFMEVIKEKFEDYGKKIKQYPDLDTLIYLKLVPLLFSASDFRHPVVTPCLVFVNQMLSRCQLKTRKDIVKGLFLVTTILECTNLSKRFLPSTLNFLSGILYMSTRKRLIQILTNPVPPTKKMSSLLVLEASQKDNKTECFKLEAKDFCLTDIDDDFKVRVLNVAVQMIHSACNNLSENVGIKYICSSFLEYLETIEIDEYPAKIRQNVQITVESLKNLTAGKMKYLVQAERKPKPLRQMEPKIEPIYEDPRRRPRVELTNKQRRDMMTKKVKKETKAAVREIRRDNEFLAKMQFKNRIQSDRERRDKVKRIFSEATTQQGELNALDRKSKYRKK